MKTVYVLYGIIVGIINSALGAGGGLIGVWALRKSNLEQKNAQATAMALILPLTVVSVGVYLARNEFSLADAVIYVPFGFLGSLTGVRLMDKADSRILRKTFALFMIYTGVRSVMK